MQKINFSETQFRSAQIDSFDPDEGVLTGRAIPYEVEIDLLPNVREVFTRGAFSRATRDPARVKLRGIDHGQEVIGHAVELEDRDDGLWVRMRVIDTAAGSDALKLLRAGSIDELSIEFRRLSQYTKVSRTQKGVHFRYDRAQLVGVAPVSDGAYGKHAKITAVRNSIALPYEDEDDPYVEAMDWFQKYRSQQL
jgi:HK97 family phage prohead protease